MKKICINNRIKVYIYFKNISFKLNNDNKLCDNIIYF